MRMTTAGALATCAAVVVLALGAPGAAADTAPVAARATNGVVGTASGASAASSVVDAASGGATIASGAGARTVAAAADLAVHADDDQYPSWADVEKAKSDAAAAKAEVDRISALVQRLQDEADAATADELAKQAASTLAQTQLAQATQKAEVLGQQASVATDAAKQAKQRFAQFASQFYVLGRVSLTTQLLVDGGSKDELLGRLGTASRLTKQASQLLEQAREKQNLAASLSAQAKAAQAVRASLAEQASQKLAVAQEAKQAADAAVATQQQNRAVLYQQAAVLQNTSEDVVQQYYAGVEKRREEQQRQQQLARGGSQQTMSLGAGVVDDPAAAQAYARSVLGSYGWSGSQFGCLVDLWNMESGWRTDAYNRSSGAYGIPQSLPANKMASAGADWMTNAATQIAWGLSYIKSAYGSPCAAWNAEISRTPHWY